MPCRSWVYAVPMPCRERSETLKINLRIMSRLNPSHPYRVPARGCRLIINALILMTNICLSEILTSGPGRHDLGTDPTRTRQHAGPDRVYGEATAQWPGTCPAFSRPNQPASGHFPYFFAPLDRYKQVKRRSTPLKFSTRGETCEKNSLNYRYVRRSSVASACLAAWDSSACRSS
jgi:hypothetical protein